MRAEFPESIVLNTKDLSVGYGNDPIVPDISFSVNKGEILVLIGPNGAGKSTVLKTLTNQLKAVAGTVFIEGKDMQELKNSEIAAKMAVLMTERPRTERMTVEDIVSAGRYPYTGLMGILDENDRAVVERSLEMVGMLQEKNKDFNAISDGQKQLTMLARAIAQEPDIMILDEPTSFLDIRHKIKLLGILKKLVFEKNMAVIMSLHELELAHKCADHILCIGNGRVDRYGTAEEIFDSNGYIEELYGVEKGCFIPEYASVELGKTEGEPEVFVIGGGGSGIPVYRKLQREGIPFAAGVIHENDIEYPIAKALACKVVTEKAFMPIGDESYEEAAKLMVQCKKVIPAVKQFAAMNEKNSELISEAEKRGIIWHGL